MKKIILFVAIATMAFGCSSDDSNPTVDPAQKIAGKWRLDSQKNDNTIVPLSECETQQTYEFGFPVNTFKATLYTSNSSNGCNSSVLTGTFLTAANSTDDYIISVGNETIVINDVVVSGSTMTTKSQDGPITVIQTWIKQ